MSASGMMGLRGVTWTNLANTSALVLFGIVFLLQFQNDMAERRREREETERARLRWEERNDRILDRFHDLNKNIERALDRMESSTRAIEGAAKKLP